MHAHQPHHHSPCRHAHPHLAEELTNNEWGSFNFFALSEGSGPGPCRKVPWADFSCLSICEVKERKDLAPSQKNPQILHAGVALALPSELLHCLTYCELGYRSDYWLLRVLQRGCPCRGMTVPACCVDRGATAADVMVQSASELLSGPLSQLHEARREDLWSPRNLAPNIMWSGMAVAKPSSGV